MRRRLPAVLAACLLGGAVMAASPVRIAPTLTDAKARDAWEFQNPDSWAVAGGVLALQKAGRPSGPIRKPAEWAILKSDPLGDVTLTAQVRSDRPETLKGRDVLLFFGYQSPTRFYYVHLSNETRGVHNGIFLVNDADRRRIDDAKGVPRLTDRAWHRVRLVRKTSDGTIAVYFDDDPAPALTASDRTLLAGRVGVGAFDDVASFREIRVEGQTTPPGR